MTVIEAKEYHAPRPGKITIFFRTFLPWQMVRFFIINMRMTVMILKSHGSKQSGKIDK